MTGKTEFGEFELPRECTENCHLKKLLKEAHTTMAHAKVFIGTRQKMHSAGQDLYEELLNDIEAVI